jgi:hypothetical protein
VLQRPQFTLGRIAHHIFHDDKSKDRHRQADKSDVNPNPGDRADYHVVQSKSDLRHDQECRHRRKGAKITGMIGIALHQRQGQSKPGGIAGGGRHALQPDRRITQINRHKRLGPGGGEKHDDQEQGGVEGA